MPLLERSFRIEGGQLGSRVSELGSQVTKRRKLGDNHIGLAHGAQSKQLSLLSPDEMDASKKVRYDKYKGNIPLEDEENYARSKVENRSMGKKCH